jgi:hypothetical protein
MTSFHLEAMGNEQQQAARSNAMFKLAMMVAKGEVWKE